MLSFFLDAQKKITKLNKESNSIENIKLQVEEFILKQPNYLFLKDFNFSQTPLISEQSLPIILHQIPDPDYSKIFQVDAEISFKQKIHPHLFALFSSALNESWKEIVACKREGDFVIRTGFFQDEFDIYQSILMGFQGATFYVTGLDFYQIQYLTEIARDYGFSILFVIHNQEELEAVLETDAPYIVISCYQQKDFNQDLSPVTNLSHRIPKTASVFALSSLKLWKGQKDLSQFNVKGIICC